MAWIESHQELREHPKTKRAARLLGVSKAQIIGHLHFLWWWTLDYAEDGDLSGFDCDDIADAAGWEDDPEPFVQALIDCGPGEQCGFLNSDLTLHDWDKYAGRLLEQRQFNRERQDRRRKLYNDSSLTKEVRERDGDRCRYCGILVNWKDKRSGGGGTYDHIDPDGENTADNIVVACRACNSSKGKRTPDESGMALLPIFTASADTRQVPNGKPTEGSAITVPDRTEPKKNKNLTVLGGEAAKEAKPKTKHQELFSALLSECHPGKEHRQLTDNERGEINNAVGQLMKIRAGPDDVHVKAERYRDRWPTMELTPSALINNWNRLDQEKPGTSKRKMSRLDKIYAGQDPYADADVSGGGP